MLLGVAQSPVSNVLFSQIFFCFFVKHIFIIAGISSPELRIVIFFSLSFDFVYFILYVNFFCSFLPDVVKLKFSEAKKNRNKIKFNSTAFFFLIFVVTAVFVVFLFFILLFFLFLFIVVFAFENLLASSVI